MVRVYVLPAAFFLMLPVELTAADQLPPGATLKAGDELVSPNGHFRLVMQGDGNLVLYHASAALWDTQTRGTGAAFCAMQGDGNLVLYGTRDGVFRAVWSSGTGKGAGGRLACQDDGNAVIYHDGQAVWQTETADRGKMLLQVLIALRIILQVPDVPEKPKPERMPKNPAPRVPAPRPKTPPASPPVATPPTSSWRVVRFGSWLVRAGGKVVPYVGLAMLVYDGSTLLYEGGEWVYHKLAGDGDLPEVDSGPVSTTDSEPGEDERITPLATGADSVALLFRRGFLCADPDVGEVVANRRQIGEWEKFRVTRHAGGTISLLAASTGKYLSARVGNGDGITADAGQVGPREHFTPEAFDGALYLKTCDGHYLSTRSHR